MGLRLILSLVTAAGPSRILTGVPLFQKRKERFDHLAASQEIYLRAAGLSN